MATIRHQVRSWSEGMLEKMLHVRIYHRPPFGTDPYAAVAALRPWSPKDVVFDVGANDGRTVFRLHQQLSGASIFAFEPVAATFEKLLERTRELPNVHCLRLALGAASGSQDIYLHERAVMNSFSPAWSPPTGTETVQVATVDQVMSDRGIDFLHFLKIDTEGYELEVLSGATQALAASRIAIVQVEVGADQRVSPHTSLEEVRAKLAPVGYFLHGIFAQCRSARRARPPQAWSEEAVGYRPSVMKYCDAVFVRAEIGGLQTA